MKLSKLGLVLLSVYLVWAVTSYFGYQDCRSRPHGGGLIEIPCELQLVTGALPASMVVPIPVQPLSSEIVAGVPPIDPAVQLRNTHIAFLVAVLLCCIFYYVLGAWIEWLRRPKTPASRDASW